MVKDVIRLTGELRVGDDRFPIDLELGERDSGDRPPSGNRPSDILDLTNWKLTLPVDEAREVLDLRGFEAKPWFQVHSSGGVQFRARVDGATTRNSSFPRSELRQMDGRELAAWSLKEEHRLEAELACTASPVAKPQVSLIQIHGGDDDVLQVLYDGTREGGAITYREFGTTKEVLLQPYQLGQRFLLRVEVRSGKVAVAVEGGQRAEFSVDDESCYWKAGAYVQSNPSKGDKPDAFGEVVIYSLRVS